MTTKKHNPLPMDLDEEDRRVEQYAARQGVPSLKSPDVEPTAPKAAVAAPDEKVTFDLPAYVAEELRLIAAKDRSSGRYLVLKALSDNGTVKVAADDLVKDRRRAKGGKK